MVLDQFECDICQKTFLQKSNLRRHKRTVHEMMDGSSPFKCDICQKTFKHAENLALHEKTPHNLIHFMTHFKLCNTAENRLSLTSQQHL